MKKNKILLAVITIIIILLPNIVIATDVNENSAESSKVPNKFTDFSNAEFEIIEHENMSGWVDLKITGIDVNTILDFTEHYNVWGGYYYYVTTDNIKPKLTFGEDGTVESINGEKDLMKYSITWNLMSYDEQQDYIVLFDGGSSYDSENTLSRISELDKDIYLWIIQTIWDDEFNCTTKFVVDGQELKRPNYAEKIDLWMTSGGTNLLGERVSIFLHNPIFSGNRKFDIKIGKIEDSTILDSIKEENSYNHNRLLKYSKENSSFYSDNLKTGDVKFIYNNEQKALFDGATLLENEEYYYIYILLDDENGKYYPFEAVAPAKASVRDERWSLKTVDAIIDNSEDNNDITNMNEKLYIIIILIAVLLLVIIIYSKYRKFKRAL